MSKANVRYERGGQPDLVRCANFKWIPSDATSAGGCTKSLYVWIVAFIVGSFGVPALAQESVAEVLSEEIGQKNMFHPSSEGFPRPTIVFGSGKAFSVRSFYPKAIGLKSTPTTTSIKVKFEIHEPSEIKVGSQLSTGRIDGWTRCGEYIQAGTYFCDVPIPKIPNGETFVTIGMQSKTLDDRTIVSFRVPTVPAEFAKWTTSGSPPPVGIDNNRTDVARPGDTQSLNPQPIPPGRSETVPDKNPGDPAPTIQNDNAIIFQRGLKNNSTASNAAVQPPPSPSLTNRAMSSSTMEVGVNRFGGDYTSRDLGTPEQCQAACKGEAQCKSWSWVKPGVQGPQPKCWLKNSVPAVSKNECCVSGVK